MSKVHANILVDPLPDNAALPPGTYSARAQDPAYGGLKAMAFDGRAEFVGERYEVDGSKWIAVRVTDTGGFTPNEAEVLEWGIDDSFYSKSLLTYKDWQEKWWREAIQNSVDAGATRIDCKVEPIPEGFAVSCTDDGRGMTVPIMDKFLKLGGSSKSSSSGTAGGFGKAKELLVMPWLAWSLDSLGKRMVGQGGTKPVRDDSPFRQGTELRVVMAPDLTTHESAAIAYIEKCYLPGVRFTVNGKRHKADLAVGEQIRTFADGKAVLYHDKGKNPGRLFVRTMGLFMFELQVSESVRGTLIIELVGASIELLADNRDAFRDYWLGSSVDKFVNALSADVRSALKKKQGIMREKFHGTGKFRGATENALQANVLKHLEEVVPAGKTRGGPALSKGQADLIRQVIDQEVGGSKYGDDDGEVTERAHGAPRGEPGAGGEQTWGTARLDAWEGGPPPTSFMETPGAGGGEEGIGRTGLNLRAFGDLVSAMLDGTSMPGPSAVEAAVKQLVWEPDFLLVNSVPGYHVPKMFWPEGMSPSMKKLARFWAELCRFVLIQVGSPEPYGIGFTFDHGMLAAYQRDSNTGEHWLLLNPYRNPSEVPTERGKKPTKDQLYGIVDDDDLNTLYALAIHEVTHMADGIYYSYCEPEDEGIQKEKHDESFASAFTRNVARCAGKDKQIREIRKAVAARDPAAARKPPTARSKPREKKAAAFAPLAPLADTHLEQVRQRTTLGSGYRYGMFVGDSEEREDFTDDLTSETLGWGTGRRDAEWRDKQADGRAVWRGKDFSQPLAGEGGSITFASAAFPPLADADLERARRTNISSSRFSLYDKETEFPRSAADLQQDLLDAYSDWSNMEIRDWAGKVVWRSERFDLPLAGARAPAEAPESTVYVPSGALPPLADKYDEQARQDTTREYATLGVRYVSFKEFGMSVYDHVREAGGLDTLIRQCSEDITNDEVFFEIREVATGLPVWRSENFGMRVAKSHAANRAFQGMDLSVADMDPDELLMGTEHEMEHTDDPDVAEQIALDHLAEDPHYYSRLAAAGIDGNLRPNRRY